MPTARDIISDAYRAAGILGVGQTLLAEDVNSGLRSLQRMTDLWQQRRWLIPALVEYTIACTGQKSYTIGTGGDLDIKRPRKLSAMWVIQNNTGQTPVSMGMRPLFAYEDYARLAVKDLNSLPYLFFYDNQFPLSNLYPWPIPNDQYMLHLLVQQQLNFPEENLDDECDLPSEYLEAIHYNLAVRICADYQVAVEPQTIKLAKAALNTIRNANTQVPQMIMPPGITRGKSFDIYNPDGYGYP